MESVSTKEDLRKLVILDLTKKNKIGYTALIEAEINFELKIPYDSEIKQGTGISIQRLAFDKCDFKEDLIFNSYQHEIWFENCIFQKKLGAKDKSFTDKIRFRNCEFHGEVNFTNTRFNGLADFWRSTFLKPTTFFKTDFNQTVVFSSAIFLENILFTYTLFGGKSIFGRTVFKKGIDFSQSIISGDLQLFDLQFSLEEYGAKYVGNHDKKYRKFIEKENKIPLINKVATFQVLKNQFSKQGNHIDEIAMRQQEKAAFSELTQERKKDKNWDKSTVGDRLILWLNRWSNHYRADFRNGISFTIIVAVIFLFSTFLTTQEFWRRLCFDCEFDPNVIGFTIKSFINFLNPAHRITYLQELKPIYGIAYIFDFFGRIAVGYGIYQTVQAFRKFR